ncbi:MAG: site-specific integrase [Candidatus Brocadia sp.]|nr:site-specific integrase [Candidatus Brocadia sp.]
MMYDDGHGITVRESAKTTSQREAEYLLNCRHKAVREGKFLDLKKIKNCKLVELAQDYLKWSERQRVYETKKYWIPQLIEVFGNLNVSDLNPKIIEQWQSERLKKNKPSTVNRLTTCLKHMVNKGVECGMASEETLKAVRKIKLLKGENKRLRYLTIEELQRLLDCCHQHLKPIVLVAVHTGMRKGEILNLKWDQVDLRNNLILLDKTKNGERREIPINSILKELFASMPRSLESEYVFVDMKGKPYGNIKRSFSTALRRAEIRDFHFHDLRHTFASHSVMTGVDLTSVKELLGHKSLTMTLRYSHLAPGHKRKAVEMLGKVLSGNQSEKRLHNLFTFSESDSDTTSCKSLRDMVGDIGLEPMTPCL